ncbi:hypothetical protein DOS86_00625 [Anaplasma marginale]|nr:hypothetical protein DOS86_00625 [Anaplasma marginale]
MGRHTWRLKPVQVPPFAGLGTVLRHTPRLLVCKEQYMHNIQSAHSSATAAGGTLRHTYTLMRTSKNR